MDILRMLEKINKTFTAEFPNFVVNDKKQLIDYCNKYWFEDVTLNTCREYLKHINTYLEEKNIDYKLTVADFKVKEVKDGLVSKKEIMAYIDILENEQDKFILYALFSGICGKDAVDLRTLKTKQINFESKKIMLADREVDMDDTMIKLVEDAIKQDSYELIKFSEGAMVQSFDFNMSSEYVIKNRPTKTNNMGLDVIKMGALRKRLETISRYIDNKITPDTLLKSGYAYMVFEKYGKDATYTQVEKLIKEKSMKASIRNVINAYKNIY